MSDLSWYLVRGDIGGGDPASDVFRVMTPLDAVQAFCELFGCGESDAVAVLLTNDQIESLGLEEG